MGLNVNLVDVTPKHLYVSTLSAAAADQVVEIINTRNQSCDPLPVWPKSDPPEIRAVYEDAFQGIIPQGVERSTVTTFIYGKGTPVK